MKGYAEVFREDLFAASIGFGVRYELAEETMKKGVDLFYEKYYTNGSRWTRWRHRKKTKKAFVRHHLDAFGTWDSALCKVLDQKECDEVHWWCWNHKGGDSKILDLYKTGAEKVLVDVEMARWINQYKDYLEKVK